MRILILILLIAAGLSASSQTILKAGDVSPSARYIDVDEFSDFKEGYCVVRKGIQTALIDTAGNYAIPFNHTFCPFPYLKVYDPTVGRIDNDECGFSDGLCLVVDVRTGLSGYVDRSIKLVIPCKYRTANHFKNGVAMVSVKGSVDDRVYINKKGQTVSIETNDYGDSPLIPSYISNTKAPYGYKDPYGKVVIPPSFYEARPFSNGMAAVMKKDEFGKGRWGYINEKGKLVIDYKYTIEPGYFYDGFAIVEPTDKTTFAYAYIDKRGEIKLTVEKADEKFMPMQVRSGNSMFAFEGRFHSRCFIEGFALRSTGNGYAFTLMDTAGKTYGYPKVSGTFYNRHNKENYTAQTFMIYMPFVNGIAKFWMPGHLYGIIDRNNNIVMQPVFDDLNVTPYDSYRFRCIYRIYGTNGSQNVKIGIVNRQGVFIILKPDPAKW